MSKDSVMISVDWQKNKYGADIDAMTKSGRNADTGIIAMQPNVRGLGNSLFTLSRILFGFDNYFKDEPFLNMGFGGSMPDGDIAMKEDLLLNAKEKEIVKNGGKITHSMTGHVIHYIAENNFATKYAPGTWWKQPTTSSKVQSYSRYKDNIHRSSCCPAVVCRQK